MVIEILSAVIVILAIVIVLQGVLYSRERKDLLNRIMSTSYSEYKLYSDDSDEPVYRGRSDEEEAIIDLSHREEKLKSLNTVLSNPMGGFNAAS